MRQVQTCQVEFFRSNILNDLISNISNISAQEFEDTAVGVVSNTLEEMRQGMTGTILEISMGLLPLLFYLESVA